ncbi:MAG: HPr family phosphocarrier protein [Elusimicrobiota bacterium]
MREKRFTIENKLGLHARPASLFVQAGVLLKSSVKVKKSADGEEIIVNGKSVMGLMMLAAACGEKVTVVLEGPDEDDGMKVFEELFARNFDE